MKRHIEAKYLAAWIARNLQANVAQFIEKWGQKRHEQRKFDYTQITQDGPSMQAHGIEFQFSTVTNNNPDSEEGHLEVVISGADPTHMEDVVQTGSYKQNPNFALLRQQQRKTQDVLKDLQFFKNSKGRYHFTATYKTEKPEKLATAILYHIVKPTCIKPRIDPFKQ